MPLSFNGKTYYRTAEVCDLAGISKNTYFRWVSQDIIPDVELRDRRGWRLFTQCEMERVINEAGKVRVYHVSTEG